ncbi:hypothetical protein ACMDCR_08085 [Labrys okinawensis]|uniref:hypothetical protein n=1 Tax=Labrys okinawensis TaxID=346911 RepID=UPI0039BC72D8
MLFNIQSDNGHAIVGYVVPDDYERTTTLRVVVEGEVIARVPTDECRISLVESGRHGTGLCGFTIDNAVVPDLFDLHDLQIFEDETGILIYRRRPASADIQERVFRIETHLFPLWHMDTALQEHFCHFHKGVDRYGSETTTQIFLLDNAQSIYISGRLPYRQYYSHLDSFACVTLLHEPYYELAERLMTLKHATKYGDTLLGPRESTILQPAIDFANALNSDGEALSRAFAAMPGPVIALLSNPIARQFAAESFDAPEPRGSVATALANLSQCALVGVRERAAPFAGDLENLLGLPPATVQIAPMLQPAQALANKLRHIPEVEILLESDLDIYAQVSEAVHHAYGMED